MDAAKEKVTPYLQTLLVPEIEAAQGPVIFQQDYATIHTTFKTNLLEKETDKNKRLVRLIHSEAPPD